VTIKKVHTKGVILFIYWYRLILHIFKKNPKKKLYLFDFIDFWWYFIFLDFI
jgi:hypothetical protein